MADWIAGPGGPITGAHEVPGDKSISHRALMFGAIAEGTTRITGFLDGEDTRATAAALQAMGVRIDATEPTERVVHGVGLRGLVAAVAPLDCGNAGTGMRLLAGLLAGQSFDSELVGDASLTRRPMRRVVEPLQAMGARIEMAAGDTPPLHVRGGQSLHGGEHRLAVPSAQVKSALLLAGLYADSPTSVLEATPTRDYTERMLHAFGAEIAHAPGRAALVPGRVLRACDITVPGDFSSAAFLLAAAAIVPGSDVTVRGVGLNARRTGLLHALEAMGARIEVTAPRDMAGEPVADVRVVHAPLRGIAVARAWVPDMIDEFPALFAVAACAAGPTVVSGAHELRVKESDRIAAMAAGLAALGIRCDEVPDGATIHPGQPASGAVQSLGDHRIAMSFAVLAQLADGPVHIADVDNVATSFPGFLALAQRAGFGLRAA